MKRIAIALLLAFVVGPAFAQEPTETPAEPRWKDAPDYPVACLGKDNNAAEQERVDVAFIINEEGLTEDVRIMRSTNICFEEAALSAVRGWVYKPRQVNGRRQPQEDMEATIIFEVEPSLQVAPEEAQVETKSRALVFDAKPIERTPPEYPVRCRPKAYATEWVVLQFDVTTAGITKNPQVVESSSDCFNESALESLKGWRYEPRTIDGETTDRVGVKALIIYRLTGGRARPEHAIRSVIRSRLGRVRRLLERGKIDDALALLEKIDMTYGDSLSPAELSEFHRIRGMVRLGANDVSGALDDLKAAKRLNSYDPENALQDLIDRLETALGVPSAEDEDAPQPEEPTAE